MFPSSLFFDKKSVIFSFNQCIGFPWDPFVLHGMGSESHCHERLSTSLLFARNDMLQPRKVSHIEHTISQTTYSVLAIHFVFHEDQIGNKSPLVQVMTRHLFCTMSLSEPMVIYSAKMMSRYDMIHAHLLVKIHSKTCHPEYHFDYSYPPSIHYRILCCDLADRGETSWIRISNIRVKQSEQPKSKSLRITTSILYYLNTNTLRHDEVFLS